MGLVPGGTALYDKLNENGLIDEAFLWLNTQLSELDLSWSRLRNAIDAAWEEMDFIRWDPFDYNLRVLKRNLLPLYNDVKEFAGRVIDKTVELVRTTMLTPLDNFIKERTRVYPLLTVILGQDPLTGEEVPRTAENFIRGFLSFVSGRMEKFNNLKESGAIDKAFAWLEKAIKKLGLIGAAFANAFTQIWESFSINDLTDPIGTFERVLAIFTSPVRMLIEFALEVGLKVLEFIFEGVLGQPEPGCWRSSKRRGVPLSRLSRNRSSLSAT